MANGTSRNALSQIALKNSKAGDEMNEQMAILRAGHGNKIPLKAGASEHNHSTDNLRSNG